VSKRPAVEVGRRPDAEKGLGEVMAIVARLRGEQGCPWDREQTHVSLKPALLEETYELLEAIERGDVQELEEELGDLLLQVVFHCQIAAEQGRFTLGDVASGLKDKLIRRHPHVFTDRSLADADAVLRGAVVSVGGGVVVFDQATGRATTASSLGDLPRAMPALARAQRITERASYVGFDWAHVEDVWDKVEEELHELRSAASSGDRNRLGEEIGDLLFSLVNLARFLDLQAEDTLVQAIDRFLRRFAHIETRLREQGRSPKEASLKEMDALWEEAKSLESQETQRG